MTVRYMPHMPELQGVSGKARYEGGTLHFDVASGTTVGLRDGRRHHRPHRARRAGAAICRLRMPITGSAPDVIRFLARPKLGLPTDVLYDYRRLGGEAAVDLSLRLSAAQFAHRRRSRHQGRGAAVEVLAEGCAGRARPHRRHGARQVRQLRAQRHRHAESSTATCVEIGWRELFGAKAPFRRRYDLKGTVPAGLVAKAGFPSVEPYVTGPVATTLHYQVATNGTSEVVGRFDIKGAKAELAPLGWTKEPGTDGQVLMTLKLAAGGKLTTIDFDGRANGLSGKGQVRFAGDNAVQQVTAAAAQDRADRHCGRLEARPGRRRARRCAARRSSCRACAP